MKRLKVYFDLFKQLGLRYTLFRIKYEFAKKLGIYKAKFPTSLPDNLYLLSVSAWKENYGQRFFVPSKEECKPIEISESKVLKDQTLKILSGKIPFFFTQWMDIGFDNDWFMHPLTKHQYDKIHWTKIPIYDPNIGDIKYVWEKSKFSYLLYLVRNDLINKEDHSEFVFHEIERWIDQNPPNIGPQYICSQEISIRLFNWSFVLFFYQNSPQLSDSLFQKIISSIEIQLDHVFHNIDFSKIAVRNNHAVSETLCLYLISLYFPFLKNADKYKKLGKQWFEGEIEFQLFDDGSDSQYSFNYHRVKIQLLSWAISSAQINGEELAPIVYEKARKSLNFLTQMVGDSKRGLLPNFGANDGSIYFKLNDCDYPNYFPQLNALAALLNLELPFEVDMLGKEDEFWFTKKLVHTPKMQIAINNGISEFPYGGYIQIREGQTITFFKTPELKFRAAQDDIFHLDIWHENVNLLRDSGSYSYNTDQATVLAFNGIKGHNSVSINGEDYMLKGPRFTWLYKPLHKSTKSVETSTYFEFESVMEVKHPFTYTLRRKVRKMKGQLHWTVEDTVLHGFLNDCLLTQFWNLGVESQLEVSIETQDRLVNSQRGEGFSSIYYGQKEKTETITLTTSKPTLKATIKIKPELNS
ncbi:MAG: heparinase II/III family protein [Bacteroidia bacterium]